MPEWCTVEFCRDALEAEHLTHMWKVQLSVEGRADIDKPVFPAAVPLIGLLVRREKNPPGPSRQWR
jgi:hypothetical protein